MKSTARGNKAGLSRSPTKGSENSKESSDCRRLLEAMYWLSPDLRSALKMSEAFFVVDAAYRSGSKPPCMKDCQPHPDHFAVSLAGTIEMHAQRLVDAQRGVEVKVLEHAYDAQLKEWEIKATRIADLLAEAADLFDSGRSPPGSYTAPSLALYAMGPSDVHEVKWCGSDNLRRWAEIVRTSSLTEVFPAAHAPSGLVKIGMAGRARETMPALRAACVRYIDKYVPETIRYRYKVIAELCVLAGHKEIQSRYVRTIVKKGK